jgi:hypothetical protein
MPSRDMTRRQAITVYGKFSRIRSDSHGVLIIRLMMAANNISLANWSMTRFQGELPRNGTSHACRCSPIFCAAHVRPPQRSSGIDRRHSKRVRSDDSYRSV